MIVTGFVLIGDAYSANFLLEHGASVSTLSPDRGESALHLVAASGPHLNSVPTSAAAAASLESLKNPFGDEDAECADALPELAAVAANLLHRGLDPDIRNKDGL